MSVEQQSVLSNFNPAPLTPREQDLVTTLRTICKLDKTNTFTADTFRRHKLDRFLKPDSQGRRNIGALFIKLKACGVAVPNGSVCSGVDANYSRRIQVWKWKEEKQP